MTRPPPKDVLNRALAAAIDAVRPATAVPPHLPPPPAQGQIKVIAAGKAAAAMAAAAEDHYLNTLGLDPTRLEGISLSRYGYGQALRRIENLEGGHPVPDVSGVAGAQRIRAFALAASSDDLVVALLSGGGSALLSLPPGPVTLDHKQQVTKALLRGGATIDEINTVRKHLSAIKGGRLAVYAAPAALVTLAISDVPNDDIAVIASGPTVPDATRSVDALEIVRKYSITVPGPVRTWLDDPASETPKSDDPAFAKSLAQVVARPADALSAAETVLASYGYEVISLGDAVEGEAREVAAHHAELAHSLKANNRRAALVSGGELTVTIHGDGRGGPNQEYALALALELSGADNIWAIAADTDGTDGGTGLATDPAGAYVAPDTLQRAKATGRDARHDLAANDSTSFFQAIGDLVETGPTRTNVNDLRVVLVDTV